MAFLIFNIQKFFFKKKSTFSRNTAKNYIKLIANEITVIRAMLNGSMRTDKFLIWSTCDNLSQELSFFIFCLRSSVESPVPLGSLLLLVDVCTSAEKNKKIYQFPQKKNHFLDQ